MKFIWVVTGGRIASHGVEALWDFSGAKPGAYTATARVKASGRQVADCTVQVLVETEEPSTKPDTRGTETGRSFLLTNKPEESGYGLYSYLLMGSPPSDTARERYLKIIVAYLTLIPSISSLEKHFPPSELNITYLPVNAQPPEKEDGAVVAEWVLEHYDYARARFLLRAIPGNNREGPYIVSSLKPLTGSVKLSAHLLQDLSHVPPHLAGSWTKEFMNQAAQEHFWEERTISQMRLKIRTTIAILAIGLPEVLIGLDSWIRRIR